MTAVCVSTSSPFVSVCLAREGVVLQSSTRESHRNASGVAIALLQELLAADSLKLTDLDGFVTDLGPGSFTGVKVGVSLVKAWGFAAGKPVAGLSAFDLIAGAGRLAIPVRKDYFAVRENGSVSFATKAELGKSTGYGLGSDDVYPDAAAFVCFWEQLSWVDPTVLTPDYLLEPSISKAKNPMIMGKTVTS